MAASSLLLAKICQAYYRERLTMAEVGARFGLSRHKIGRMLQEAEELGVVRIDVRAPVSQASDLERVSASRPVSLPGSSRILPPTR